MNKERIKRYLAQLTAPMIPWRLIICQAREALVLFPYLQDHDGLAKSAGTVQTTVQVNSVSIGGPMNHSQTVQTRRRKQKAKKDLAVMAKRAKKLRKQTAKAAGAGAPKSP